VRLFVALAVPVAVRDVLAEAATPLRRQHPALRWNRTTTWHLTLAFLGETGVGGRLRVQIALQTVARSARPCAIAIDGRLGRFGDRVLWAAVASPDGRLTTLARSVNEALRGIGVRSDDRPFRAHLTLARGGRGQRVPRRPVRLDGPGLPVGWTASTVALMASQLGPDGSRYRTVATWPLGSSSPHP
jgi:2'-5' RNA ligase